MRIIGWNTSYSILWYMHTKFTDTYSIVYAQIAFLLSLKNGWGNNMESKQFFLILRCFLVHYDIKIAHAVHILNLLVFAWLQLIVIIAGLISSPSSCHWLHLCKFQDFLNDPSPTVRATAVHGVFHIVALFWEVIPAHVIKELFSKIVSFQSSENPCVKTFINC